MKLRTLNCRGNRAAVEAETMEDEIAANILAVAAIQNSMSVQRLEMHQQVVCSPHSVIDYCDDRLLSFNRYHEDERPRLQRRRYSFPSSCSASLGSVDDDGNESTPSLEEILSQTNDGKDTTRSLNLYDSREETPLPPIPLVIDTTVWTNTTACAATSKHGASKSRKHQVLGIRRRLRSHRRRRRHPALQKGHKTTRARLHAMS
mmetsp:Transcript_26932/g.61954  ORF Transcript_26932/g.61954 Transcript_26932/m.61954 type:complete len:204 (+) Transcript_26932:4057-4668(+)